MYIEPTQAYYRGTEQCAARGRFLLLLQLKQSTISLECSPENTYAVVRRVALRQVGQFMMGRANINGKWVSVSGAYGSDGLPMHVDALPRDAVPLPRNLYDAWAHGGGWNGAGGEATAMRQWSLETFKGK